MIKRDSWGHLHCSVTDVIVGLLQDKQRRKHLPGVFIIKNESQRFEDDKTLL